MDTARVEYGIGGRFVSDVGGCNHTTRSEFGQHGNKWRGKTSSMNARKIREQTTCSFLS